MVIDMKVSFQHYYIVGSGLANPAARGTFAVHFCIVHYQIRTAQELFNCVTIVGKYDKTD